MTDAADVDPNAAGGHWLDASPPARIELGPLTLRRWQAADAPALLVAVLDSMDELEPWMPWARDYDAAAAAGFLDDAIGSWEARTDLLYALIDADDEVLGSFGLHLRRGPGRLEVGYWLCSDATGHGYATLASAALTQAAFELARVEAVEIHVDRANRRSRAVPERLGFRLVEQHDREPTSPGEEGVELVYALTGAELTGSGIPELVRSAQRGASAS